MKGEVDETGLACWDGGDVDKLGLDFWDGGDIDKNEAPEQGAPAAAVVARRPEESSSTSPSSSHSESESDAQNFPMPELRLAQERSVISSLAL